MSFIPLTRKIDSGKCTTNHIIMEISYLKAQHIENSNFSEPSHIICFPLTLNR